MLIAKRLAELMGGQVGVDSVFGPRFEPYFFEIDIDTNVEILTERAEREAEPPRSRKRGRRRQ